MVCGDLAIGIDVGGTKIAGSIVDSAGALLGTPLQIPAPAREGGQAMCDAIASIARRLVEQSPYEPSRFCGVGVGTTGVVDSDQGLIVSSTDALVGWKGVRLADELTSRLDDLGDYIVHVDNDVNAYAEGEAWCGAGRDASIVLVAAVGTGVGGAVVIDGNVVSGTRYCAGEIGHIPAIGAEGEPCTCGLTGHLEAISAGPQIYRRYRQRGGDSSVKDTKELAERARAGDELAIRVYDDSARALALCLAGLAVTIDPDVIVISGGVAQAGSIWTDPLRRYFAAELIEPLRTLELSWTQLGTQAPIIGAAHSVFARAHR